MKIINILLVVLVGGFLLLPASAQEVTIQNLYDAFGPEDEALTRDWGYSALVRYGDVTILFDAGNNAGLLEKNAKALGVDLREVDFAVLSHRHSDHASGFDAFVERNTAATLYLPPDGSLGMPSHWRTSVLPQDRHPELSRKEMYYGGDRREGVYRPGPRFRGANTEFVETSRWIAPGVFLLVTKSELTGDFSRYPPHGQEPRLEGLPELSLVLETEQGLVVITGCSHSRVEHIVSKAREEMKKDVALLVGGFHLGPYDNDTIEQLARELKEKMGVHRVAPAHCTGHAGFKVFRRVFGENYHYAGLGSVVRLSK